MNNKGFTLVELLAVIVILAGISLTTVMGISASLERRDEKEYNEQVEIAKNAAKIYFSLLAKNSEITKVSVDTLLENDYFDIKKVNRLCKNDTITSGGIFNSVSDTGTECQRVEE